jgi:hypothetical protein
MFRVPLPCGAPEVNDGRSVPRLKGYAICAAVLTGIFFTRNAAQKAAIRGQHRTVSTGTPPEP